MAVALTSVDEYGVVGHPVAHSLSPVIHACFGVTCDRALRYRQHDARPEDFPDLVHELAAAGVRGLNVTLPHKPAALMLADHSSERATLAGAANWLSFEGDGIRADNTDGAGLVRDLEESLGVRLAGARILVLGAGGAARGVLGELQARDPARLCIANRTKRRAHGLAELHPGVEAGGHDAFDGETFDLIVNATSAGASGSAQLLSPGLRAAGAVCYDMMYGAETEFQRFARDAGSARVVDGLGMLIEQAAESFGLWHGMRPDTAAVRARLMPRSD